MLPPHLCCQEPPQVAAHASIRPAATVEPGQPSRGRPSRPSRRCSASPAGPTAPAGPAPQPHQPPRPHSASQQFPATSGRPSAPAPPPASLHAPLNPAKYRKKESALASTILQQQQHSGNQHGGGGAGEGWRTDFALCSRRKAARCRIPHRRRQLPSPDAAGDGQSAANRAPASRYPTAPAPQRCRPASHRPWRPKPPPVAAAALSGRRTSNLELKWRKPLCALAAKNLLRVSAAVSLLGTNKAHQTGSRLIRTC